MQTLVTVNSRYIWALSNLSTTSDLPLPNTDDDDNNDKGKEIIDLIIKNKHFLWNN